METRPGGKSAWRARWSVRFYGPRYSHRIASFEAGARSVFIGLLRTQRPRPNADVQVPEGWAHYTEVGNGMR